MNGAHHVPKVDLCPVFSLGLGGEEQAGESPAAAVSVHEGQGVLHVMLNHGGHRGEDLLVIPALPTKGIVVPAVKLPDGNVEDPASEEYCQSEGLGTVRPRAEAHRVGSILLEVKQGSLNRLTVTVPRVPRLTQQAAILSSRGCRGSRQLPSFQRGIHSSIPSLLVTNHWLGQSRCSWQRNWRHQGFGAQRPSQGWGWIGLTLQVDVFIWFLCPICCHSSRCTSSSPSKNRSLLWGCRLQVHCSLQREMVARGRAIRKGRVYGESSGLGRLRWGRW